MEIASFKVGERRVRDGAVSYELLDAIGKRCGMFRVNSTQQAAEKLIAASRIVVEAGPR